MDVQVILKEEDYKELLKYKEYYDNSYVRFITGMASNLYGYAETKDDVIVPIADGGDIGAWANGMVFKKTIFKRDKDEFVKQEDINKEINKKFNEVVKQKNDIIEKQEDKIQYVNKKYRELLFWIRNNSKTYNEYKKDFGDVIYISGINSYNNGR